MRVFMLQLYLGVLCFRLGATGVGFMEWDILISEFIIFLTIPILNNYSGLSRCYYEVMQNMLGCIIDPLHKDTAFRIATANWFRVAYAGYHDIFLN